MFESIITEKINQIATDLGSSDLKFSINNPSNKDFGDLATNIALILAGKLKKQPLEIAEEIKEKLLELELIDKIEIKAPGFINIFLKQTSFLEVLHESLSKEDFGQKNIGKNKKVVLEHTNVNPNKALHIGHLRNSCLGSSCEKILEFLGYDIEAQYYVDDTGVQVAVTTLGLKRLYEQPKKGEKYDHFAGRVYVQMMKEIEKSPELQEEQKKIIHELDSQNGDGAYIAKEMATKVIYSNLETMHNLNIDYDLLVWENDIINEGFWGRAFVILKLNHHFKHVKEGKNEGCWVIENILGEDKVIVKSNGVATYTGKDIAYHMWKFNLLAKDFRYRAWPKKLQEKDLYTTSSDGIEKHIFGHADLVVNFVDVRQTFPQMAVKESLKALGFKKQAENLMHVGYGIVFLSPETARELGIDTRDDKSHYAMSGRLGIGILADDLLSLVEQKIKESHPDSPATKDVTIGAIKYHMLKYNTYSDIVFDLKQATDFYGNSGPYLQYTYARAKSVLSKAENAIKTPEKYDDLNLEEKNILQAVSQFSAAIEEAGKQYSPSILCNYLYELSKLFNTFYGRHPVLAPSNTDETINFRLALTKSVSIVLRKGLTLLGMPAPEKM